MLHRNREKAMQSIVDYVEGEINILQFQELLETNRKLQGILSDYAKSVNNCIFGKEIIKYTMQLKNSISDKESLQEILEGILKRYMVEYRAYDMYKKNLDYILDIQPSWLDCVDDQGIYDKILEEVPKDISKTKQIAWGKARIKELFRYDKTYPRWVQSPEWPIVNGKPLVFSHQSKEKKDDERVYYYFYDPETKEETVVMQLY